MIDVHGTGGVFSYYGQIGLLETELEGQPDPWRPAGPGGGDVHLYGDAVLVGGAVPVFGYGSNVFVRAAGGTDCEHNLLAAIGVVPAEGIHPAEELSAILCQVPLEGPWCGNLTVGVSGGFCAVCPMDAAVATYSWGMVYFVSVTVSGL